MGPSSPAGSSHSPTERSPRSLPSARDWPPSASAGRPAESSDLTPSELRALAARHGIRPKKSLGQHFLIEPSLARKIAELAEVGPGTHVVEVGAGLGSLTRALAELGANVLALELDRALVPALQETTDGFGRVRVERVDAVRADWPRLLAEADRWVMVANLPYNVAVPVVMGALHRAPTIERMLVMVQREVGERLAAGPGQEHYGAVSVRVASMAEARVVRRVAASVFWPRPRVESVLVRIDRRASPVAGPDSTLFRVVEGAFAERRKTMRNALLRLGLGGDEALAALRACGIAPSARPEELGLEAFLCLAEQLAE